MRGRELLGPWGEVWAGPVPEILCGLGRGAFLGPQLWKTTIASCPESWQGGRAGTFHSTGAPPGRGSRDPQAQPHAASPLLSPAPALLLTPLKGGDMGVGQKKGEKIPTAKTSYKKTPG